MTEVLLLLLAVVLVLACGGFVAAEFALVTVDRSSVDAAVRDSDTSARGVQLALQNLSTELSGAQVGITVTNLAIGYLAEPAIGALVADQLGAVGLSEGAAEATSVAIGIVLATTLTMVFGELVPKNIAIARPYATAKATAGYQRGFTTLMRGPIAVLNGAANAVVRRLGVEPQEELRSARGSEELRSLVRRSASQGTLAPETARLLDRSVSFGDRTAADVMTPRVRTTTIRATASVEDLVALARESGRSRFPVVRDGADDLLGAVHVKHATRVPRAARVTTPVTDILVTAPEVPTSLPLAALSERLRGEGFQLAFVVDEYGGTAGLVTMEDVIEEIVGDIVDEHDPLPDRTSSRAHPGPDGSWSLSGLLRPDEVAAATGIELPTDDSYDTVAGLVLSVLGRIPRPGDEATVAARGPDSPADEPVASTAVLRVEALDGLRVDRVTLRLVAPAAEEEQP